LADPRSFPTRRSSDLGHPIVNHLGGYMNRRLARNEDHPAPVLPLHAGQIVPGQANPAQNVDLEKVQPVRVRYLREGLHFENAERSEEHTSELQSRVDI